MNNKIIDEILEWVVNYNIPKLHEYFYNVAYNQFGINLQGIYNKEIVFKMDVDKQTVSNKNNSFTFFEKLYLYKDKKISITIGDKK